MGVQLRVVNNAACTGPVDETFTGGRESGPMDLRRFRYVVPNLFTLANIFAGLYSIKLALTAQSLEDVTVAAWLVVVSMVCDLADGRVARLTDAESEFGGQMDSLTDAVSFGVAPAMLMYAWGLQALGVAGMVFAFIFACGAIMRLARFNVMASDTDGASKYFLGLPTPLAAGTVISIVFSHNSVTGVAATGAPWNVAAISVLLGGLMVSNVRYRTFKDVDFRGRSMAVLVVLAGLVAGIAIVVEPSVAFVASMVAYIVFGLLGGVVRWSRNVFGNDSETDQTPLQSGEKSWVEVRDEER